MTDVSAFSDIVDRITIMTYDINGAWNSTTGPNAPFNFEPGHGDADSYVSAIQGWISAKADKNKLVPGVAFYGRSASKILLPKKKKKKTPDHLWLLKFNKLLFI